MLKKLALAAVATVAVGAPPLVVLASRPLTDRDAPLPQIVADTSPEGVARGEAIFHTMCEACHLDRGAERATGAEMADAPAFLGRFHSANITMHPTAGIGQRTDAEIARAIRFATGYDGRWVPMGFAFADADVAAVLGYLRSGPPVLAPDPTVAPKTELSWAGRVVLWAAGALEVPDRPAQGIEMPPRTDLLAYGRYVAQDLYDCVGCHTVGYSPDKKDGPDAYAGGFEFRDLDGNPVPSTRIRFDDQGLADWTREDLGHAVRDGLRPDGSPLRYPMMKFRGLQDDELAALDVWLRSIGPDGRSDPARVADYHPAPAAPPPTLVDRVAAGEEAAAFTAFGCVACHAEGTPFADRIAAAKGKAPSTLAAWILRPQDTKPGTPMPSYAAQMTEPDALALATWIAAGTPSAVAER